jgi:hypothetical protein
MKLIIRLMAVIGLATYGAFAGADPCSAVLASYASCLADAPAFAAVRANIQCIPSAIVINNPECFAGSATNGQIEITLTSFAQANAISRALSTRFLENGPGGLAVSDRKGMAAGSAAKAWNVWGNATDNDTRQTYDVLTVGTSKTINNSADVLNAIVGADYALSQTLVIGLSGAFDRGSGSGRNSVGSQNDLSSHGYQIAPYLGLQLSKDLALDASAGFGTGKLTMGGSVTAESDRWFAGANLSYSHWMGNIQLLGRLGYLHGEEQYSDSKIGGATVTRTAATNKVEQVRAGVQAGYWMNGVMPYVGLSYSNDLRRTTTLTAADYDPIGKAAWVWTVGVSFLSLASDLTGGISYSQEEDRTHQKNNTLIANIGVRF